MQSQSTIIFVMIASVCSVSGMGNELPPLEKHTSLIMKAALLSAAQEQRETANLCTCLLVGNTCTCGDKKRKIYHLAPLPKKK